MNKKGRNPYEFDKSFYVLAKEVTKAIEEAKDGSTQKEQVEELMKAEVMFRKTILKYRQSNEIYKKFLLKINKGVIARVAGLLEPPLPRLGRVECLASYLPIQQISFLGVVAIRLNAEIPVLFADSLHLA